jgi:DNA repair protein RAD50
MTEGVESVSLSIGTLAVEIQAKKDRLDNLKASIASAKYDVRLAEFTKTARTLEERREELNSELQSLTLQADTRARLDLKRAEVKAKSLETQNT